MDSDESTPDNPKTAPAPISVDQEADGRFTGEEAAARNRREDPPV